MAELDLLVLGSGVAGLSAAVRAARRSGCRSACSPRASSTWPRPGGRRAAWPRRCSGRPRLDRPPPGRHPRRRRGAVRRRRRARARGRGPGAGARSSSRSARRSTATPTVASSWRARAGTRCPGSSTPGGDATGAEIERALVEAVRRTATAVHEQAFALDLLVEGGRVPRRRRRRRRDGQTARGARPPRARSPPAAPGSCSRSPPTRAWPPATASPWRCGRAWRVADVEFMQFHPTALHHPSMPRPLLSEALRGHGALLRDGTGDRFVDELLPRDVVVAGDHRRDARPGRSTTCGSTPPGSSSSPSASRRSRPTSRRSASTPRPTGCRSPRPRTTCAAGS